MKKTGIFYSFNTKNTKSVAELIQEKFNDKSIEMVNAEDLTEQNFIKYDNYIIGAPTWFDGELPNYWDEFIPALEDMDFKNKNFAIFGLGDQKKYPENFGDAVGILAKLFEQRGGKIVGYTSTKGYEFEKSGAVKENKFQGLMIDIENQNNLTEERVNEWVKKIKKELV